MCQALKSWGTVPLYLPYSTYPYPVRTVPKFETFQRVGPYSLGFVSPACFSAARTESTKRTTSY